MEYFFIFLSPHLTPLWAVSAWLGNPQTNFVSTPTTYFAFLVISYNVDTNYIHMRCGHAWLYLSLGWVLCPPHASHLFPMLPLGSNVTAYDCITGKYGVYFKGLPLTAWCCSKWHQWYICVYICWSYGYMQCGLMAVLASPLITCRLILKLRVLCYILSNNICSQDLSRSPCDCICNRHKNRQYTVCFPFHKGMGVNLALLLLRTVLQHVWMCGHIHQQILLSHTHNTKARIY